MSPTTKPITAPSGPKTNTLVIAASTERSCTLDENQSMRKYPAKAANTYPPTAQRRPMAKRFIGSGRPPAAARFRPSHRLRHCGADDSLRFGNDHFEVALVAKALAVDLVDVFGARRARRKPPALRHNLEPTDGGAVAWCSRELRGDRLAGELRRGNVGWSELAEPRFLRRSRRCVDASVEWHPELARELGVMLARILSGPRSDLGSEQVHDRAVLVGGPHGAVQSQEACAGAL